MHRHPGLAPSLLRLAITTALTLLISGCVIFSEQPLVGPREGAALLPDTAYLFGYDEDGNTLTPSKDEPLALQRAGGAYEAADRSLSVRFVPLGAEGLYLAAITQPDLHTYGIASLEDGLLVLRIVLGDADPWEEVSTALAGDAALAGVAEEDGGLKVRDRAALDAMIGLVLAGRLELDGIVMFVAESATATPPRRLIRDGDSVRAE